MDLWRLFNMSNLYHVHHLCSFLKDELSRLYCPLPVYISYIGRMEPRFCPTSAVEVVTACNRCIKGVSWRVRRFDDISCAWPPAGRLKAAVSCQYRSNCSIVAALLPAHSHWYQHRRLYIGETFKPCATLPDDKPEHLDERRGTAAKSTVCAH